MAKIIIIRGTQQSGKTTTTGLVYQELLKICAKEHKFNNIQVDKNSLIYSENGDTVDFTAILNSRNKTIGIVSAGDVANDLEIEINIFIKINIDIIICCARSKNIAGSSYRRILDKFSETNTVVLEIFTEHSENKEHKNEVKKKVVDKIVGKVKELLEE